MKAWRSVFSRCPDGCSASTTPSAIETIRRALGRRPQLPTQPSSDHPQARDAQRTCHLGAARRLAWIARRRRRLQVLYKAFGPVEITHRAGDSESTAWTGSSDGPPSKRSTRSATALAAAWSRSARNSDRKFSVRAPLGRAALCERAPDRRQRAEEPTHGTAARIATPITDVGHVCLLETGYAVWISLDAYVGSGTCDPGTAGEPSQNRGFPPGLNSPPSSVWLEAFVVFELFLIAVADDGEVFAHP